MPSTAHGFPYPNPTDPVAQGAAAIQNLAQAVEGRVLIADQLVGGGRAGDPAAPLAMFDISAIPQTYGTLFAQLTGRSDVSALVSGLNVRVNADSGSNYEWAFVQIDSAGTVTGSGGGAVSAVQGPLVPGATAPAGYFGATEIEIPNYTGAIGSKPLLFRTFAFGIAAGAFATRQGGGSWRTPNVAITRLQISPVSGLFVAGSRLFLWGH